MLEILRTWVEIPYNDLDTKVFHAGLFAHGCILRTYADIPNNYLSTNAGLCVQVHRHMNVFCVRMQIFFNNEFDRPTLDYLCIWTDMDVFFVRTQEFLIMILIGIIQLAIDLGVSAHVRKKLPCLY